MVGFCEMHDNTEKWKLILASASPRRKELLGRTGVAFEVKVSNTEENSLATEPSHFSLEVARLKSRAVRDSLGDGAKLVVAADTVVALAGKILGKPSDVNEARHFLQALNGHSHEVCTALVLSARDGSGWKDFEWVEKTTVHFRQSPADVLEAYLATGDSLDKAGGYGIQGQALGLIEGIEGCYGNVVGFPLARFCAMMEGPVSNWRGWTLPWQNYFG